MFKLKARSTRTRKKVRKATAAEIHTKRMYISKQIVSTVCAVSTHILYKIEESILLAVSLFFSFTVCVCVYLHKLQCWKISRTKCKTKKNEVRGSKNTHYWNACFTFITMLTLVHTITQITRNDSFSSGTHVKGDPKKKLFFRMRE